jgi:hypothetical protein
LFATLLVLFIKTTVPQSPGNNRLARTSPSAGRRFIRNQLSSRASL